MCPPTLSDSFKVNLLRRRQQAGLTQEKLAHLAGFHRNVVGLLERGEMSPTLRTVDRLARALGIPGSELVRDPSP